MIVDRLIEVLERSGLAKFAEQMDAADAATDQVRIEALDPRAVPDAAADDFRAKWCELTTPNADDGPLLARIREILRTGDVDRPSPDLRLVKGTDEA